MQFGVRVREACCDTSMDLAGVPVEFGPMRSRVSTLSWKDAGPGLLLAGAIALASSTVFFLDTILRRVEEGPLLVVTAAAAPGLAPGSTVWVAGRPAGRVLSVELQGPGESGVGKVVIDAVLHRTVVGVIRADARASIEPADLLEPVVLTVDPGSALAPAFEFADTLRATTAVLDQDRVLADMDSLRLQLAAQRPDAEALRRAIREGTGTAALLREDTALQGALRKNRQRLGSVLGSGKPQGTLGRLMRDTILRRSVDSLRIRFARFATLQDSLRDSGEMHLADAVASLRSVRSSLKAMEDRLSSAEGTVGRALHDDAIHQQAALLRARIDSTLTELMAAPGLWLRIRLF